MSYNSENSTPKQTKLSLWEWYEVGYQVFSTFPIPLKAKYKLYCRLRAYEEKHNKPVLVEPDFLAKLASEAANTPAYLVKQTLDLATKDEVGVILVMEGSRYFASSDFLAKHPEYAQRDKTEKLESEFTIYAFRIGSDSAVKIGETRKTPEQRAYAITSQTGVPKEKINIFFRRIAPVGSFGRVKDNDVIEELSSMGCRIVGAKRREWIEATNEQVEEAFARVVSRFRENEPE